MSASYEKRQEKWVEKHDIEVGDFVTVLQRYDSKTCGTWTDWYYWAPEMDKFVSKVCRVVKICEDAIKLSLEGCSVSYYFPYSVLRKEKEVKKSYIERQDEWIKKNDLKIGDKVRITRKAADFEGGWGVGWASFPMDASIGKEARVQRFNDWAGICVNVEGGLGSWNLPYFVLEKIKHEEKEVKESYIERQEEWADKNQIEVGSTVRVIRRAKQGEDGWRAAWAERMDAIVGEAGVVKDFVGDAGVRVRFNEKLSWSLPYFVLEKVIERKDKEWKVSYGLKVKTGDPVLVRDGRNDEWRYTLFSHVLTGDNVVCPYRTTGLTYLLCIPYKGNEHLVGTKKDYKAHEEPTKPKFIFGAKVKATVSRGEEKEGILIGFDAEDDDTPFEVAVQNENMPFAYVTYWVKEITYID